MVTYADRPWTKSYDEGVPHSLEPYPEIPLYALLDDAAKNHGDRVACIVSLELPVVGRIYNEVSYRELGELSDRLAAALAIWASGDRVAVDLVNGAQFAIAFFGILKAGGIVVALNPTFHRPRKPARS